LANVASLSWNGHVLRHRSARPLPGDALLADVLQAQFAFLLQRQLMFAADVGEHAGRTTIGDDDQAYLRECDGSCDAPSRLRSPTVDSGM
jgi:hypothetical protein